MLHLMKKGRASSELCCGNQSHQHEKGSHQHHKSQINILLMLQENIIAPCIEGDKVYDKAGDCPVCGMDFAKAPGFNSVKTMYTCPMHPEIIQEGPGFVRYADLVPMEPSESEDNKTYS
jgi:Cu2+-exporting ATPase